MKLKTLLSAITFVMLLVSCATKVPLSETFYNDKKVGILVKVDSINRFKSGSQGLLDMAISSGSKYKEALQSIGNQVNPRQVFENVITEKLQEKSKSFYLIEDFIDFKAFQKFDKPNTENKIKFYDRDLRSLKQKYDIDELIIVQVRYGLTISYYGMIETGKGGSTNIDIDVLDLNDNSILLRDKLVELEVFKGKWDKPPYYTELKDNIEKTVIRSSDNLKTKF